MVGITSHTFLFFFFPMSIETKTKHTRHQRRCFSRASLQHRLILKIYVATWLLVQKRSQFPTNDMGRFLFVWESTFEILLVDSSVLQLGTW